MKIKNFLMPLLLIALAVASVSYIAHSLIDFIDVKSYSSFILIFLSNPSNISQFISEMFVGILLLGILAFYAVPQLNFKNNVKLIVWVLMISIPLQIKYLSSGLYQMSWHITIFLLNSLLLYVAGKFAFNKYKIKL